MEEPHNEPHDLSNTVIAILESAPKVRAAVDELEAAGMNIEVLNGEAGRSHLDADAATGVGAKLRQLARALGDETRILRHLDTALAHGRTVLSVDADAEQASVAAAILEQHDGKYLWRFGEWSFNRIGTADEDETSDEGDEDGEKPLPGRRPGEPNDQGRR